MEQNATTVTPQTTTKEQQYNGQIKQDKFVLNLTNFKKNGFFIEIGSNHPKINNNSYILEKKFNWKGIMIEYDEKWLNLYKTERKNSHHIIYDAVKIDYNLLLEKYNAPRNIDYLQIDLEVVNGSTLKVLHHFDKNVFDKYKFGVITFEHDHYRDNGKWSITRNISRDIFKKRGYIRIFSDVNQNNTRKNKEGTKKIIIFEDWYVHPDLINTDYINYLIKVNEKNYKKTGKNDGYINTIAYNEIIY